MLRVLLVLFILGVLSATHLGAARPNIVFLLSDDHRYDLMGFHEDAPQWLETPAMDRLAREGGSSGQCLRFNLIVLAESGFDSDRAVHAPSSGGG